MRYKILGKSGLRVSELCLGTMTFGETWGWGASKADSLVMFNQYTDAGGNFIDTSVNYTDGTSEQFIGEFLQGRRDQYVVATKYALTDPKNTNPNTSGNNRKNLLRSVEVSLKNLQVENIDILYLHVWDYMTPVDEVMRGLEALVNSGKVSYIAISDTPAYIIAEANTLATLRGWAPFIGVQVPYSLNSRAIERDVLPMAKHHGLAVLPWGLIGGGVLTGKYVESSDEPTRYDRATLKTREQTQAIIDEVAKIAEETGRTRAQVAINWVRQQQHRAQIIPILGARTEKQLSDNLAVLAWSLSDEQLARLTEVSKIELGFPHSFIPANPYLYGSTYDQIDHDGKPIRG
jgi:aryl-alcohol dehydrogenase-like predicted oxidoreductase